MFIDLQLNPITAPDELNVATGFHRLRSAGAQIQVEAGAINFWPRRGQILPPNKHTITHTT